MAEHYTLRITDQRSGQIAALEALTGLTGPAAVIDFALATTLAHYGAQEAEMTERLTQEQSEIVDRTGSEDWAQVVDQFGGMTRDEIAASVEDIWPKEPGNAKLVEALVDVLRCA